MRVRLTLLTVAVFFATTGLLTAQQWSLDSSYTLTIKAEAIADEGGRLPWAGIDPALDPWGLCPVLDPPAPPPPDAVHDWTKTIGYTPDRILLMCPATTDTFDLGASASVSCTDEDLTPPPVFVNGDATTVIGINGLGTRTIEIKWRSTTHPSCGSEFYFARACSELMTQLPLIIDTYPSGADLRVLYEWDFQYEGVPLHECPGDPSCGAKTFEDPEFIMGDLDLDIDGNGPGLIYSFFDNTLNTGTGTGTVDIPNAPDSVVVTASILSAAMATIEWPGPQCVPQGFCDHAGSEFCGSLTLTVYARTFIPPYNQPICGGYLRPVDSTGDGPNYTFSISQYEITNEQYSDFLNSAEADAGATALSSFMTWDADGNVFTTGGDPMFYGNPALPGSKIYYDPFKPAGYRYSVVPGYEKFPAVGMTWVGAVKFCNWLTIVESLGLGERCYTEGNDLMDWHPVTISTSDWQTRDLNSSERLNLVSNYDGFRLPMDNQGVLTGWISNQVDIYNEFYKAAAYDPAAPSSRTGPGSATVPDNHWFYGFGRDVIGSDDANYLNSVDPFDNDDAPVGYFNGATFLANGITPTENSNNYYDLYDMSGNVWEWVQCQAIGLWSQHGLRTGSFLDTPDLTAASYRSPAAVTDYGEHIGFRVVSAMCASAGYVCGDANGDGMVNVGDAIYIINFVFKGGPPPVPMNAGDANCDGGVNVGDAVYIINFVFSGGPAPCCP